MTNPFRQPDRPPPLRRLRKKHRVSPYSTARSIDTMHILRYLRSSRTAPVDEAENEAILDWLFTPPKKKAPSSSGNSAEGASPTKGN